MAASAARFALYRGSECLYCGPDERWLLYALQSDAEWQVAVRSPNHTFIHAGAVRYKGRGLLLPGVSGAGKTTLVSRLLTMGAEYYSDEYAVIDSRGELLPFSCLLKHKDRPAGAQRVRAEEFGAEVGRGGAAVDLVVFPTYQVGSELDIEELSTGSGALRLLTHMPAARLHPARALATAAALAEGARCLSVRHADGSRVAAECARWLTQSD